MKDDAKRYVKETFSKNKEAYVQSSTHKRQSDLDLITEWVQPKKDWKALDIATGGGHVAKQISHSAGTVFATDLTKDMLQNTARHLSDLPNIHYVVADAEDLPFIDGSFDLVTCRIAPHHFPHPDQFIQEVQRVLKPGGCFLMIDNVAPEDDDLDHFYNKFEKMRDRSHVRALKVSEWKNHLNHHHLTIAKELSRKKTLPFKDWVERTLDTEAEQNHVENFFLKANADSANHFLIDRPEGKVQSFSIDEWMVLARKES